ncbi:MAG: 50S ribosomal protein L30e [Candidatus Lokiarchaeota archaeon]|nr:50S ribosomal protein L30e [Candidatus Harpocratesius repetitus]
MSYRRGQQKLKRRKRSSAKSLWDEGKEINVAVKTGKVLLGERSVTRELSMGDLKMIVLARNAPAKVVNQIKILNNCLESPIPVYVSKNSSWELGAICARPHWVSVVGVINPGDSSIMKAVEK